MTEQRNLVTPDTDERAEKCSEDSSSASGAPPVGFANLEDKGGWLTFRVTRATGSIPVRITERRWKTTLAQGRVRKVWPRPTVNTA